MDIPVGSPRLIPLLEGLEAAEDFAALQHVIEALRAHYSVRHMIYHWVSATGPQVAVGTYSAEWVARYTEQGYHRIDPVISGCNQRVDPVDWKALDWVGKAVRAFHADAIAHGVGRQGWSVPVRGPNGQFALLTVSDDRNDLAWQGFCAAHRYSLMLIARLFNQAALALVPDRPGAPPPPLSRRELDALTMLADGLSRGRAADRLEISEHTLRIYIESARFKLGAQNTTHAVARAVNLGLIVA